MYSSAGKALVCVNHMAFEEVTPVLRRKLLVFKTLTWNYHIADMAMLSSFFIKPQFGSSIITFQAALKHESHIICFMMRNHQKNMPALIIETDTLWWVRSRYIRPHETGSSILVAVKSKKNGGGQYLVCVFALRLVAVSKHSANEQAEFGVYGCALCVCVTPCCEL